MKVYTKKEAVLMDREIAKLERLYGGLKGLDRLPAAIFIVDVKREETAAKEAKKRGVAVVAIADTNANLDLIDRPIPANDDSIKSIRIITQTIAKAVSEGKVLDEKGGLPQGEEIVHEEKVIIEEKEEEKPKVEKAKKVTKAKKETQSTRKASAGESKRTKAKKAMKETKVRKATKVTRAETKSKTKKIPKRKK